MAGTTYGVALLGLSSWTLLDAFVLERDTVSATEENTSMIQTASSTSSSDTSGSSDSGEATVTSSSYSDDNISIDIKTGTTSNTTYYLADIQLSSLEYLKCAFAKGTYGRNVKETTSTIAEENSAILAINGDYYGWRDAGYVIRNGVLYRETADTGTDCLVIWGDGTFSSATEGETSAQDLLDSGAWQVLSFGPVLLDNGELMVSEDDEVSQSKSSNPRTAIAMVEPLHYQFFVSDGRTSESEGLSLYQMAELLSENGATFAYNLDGGGSSTMYFNGSVVNNPTDGTNMGERSVSDIVYIGY
ncbi:MAG: phosphodiester glycosidase family protein [Tractidigestivibacter sp.]